MLILALEYLTGRSVATRFSERDEPEWPPHPARLFSAMVAAMHETGNDADERSALQWLERQEPPALSVSDATPRTTVSAFVPVNDSNEQFKRKKDGVRLLQPISSTCELRRDRQERSFPSVTPDNASVHFVWDRAEPPESFRAALAALAAKVTYLGHSSSLVSLRVSTDRPDAVLLPDDAGSLTLRVPGPGQLEALDRAFETRATSGQRVRLPARFQKYRRQDKDATIPAEEALGVFGDMIVFRRVEGRAIPLTAAALVANAMRDAAMCKSVQPVPQVLSGHLPDGTRSETPHVAFVALGDVGHDHADGHLMGVAAVLPRSLAGDERRSVLHALGKIERLTMGSLGAWVVERVTAEVTQRGLTTAAWTRPAKRWASVTPVVLDRFPSERYGAEAEEIVATSCERVGLPRPTDVVVAPVSLIQGVPLSRTFQPPHKPGTPHRLQVHAVLTFPIAVSGPVLIGAGRYRSLGLCRPLPGSSCGSERQL